MSTFQWVWRYSCLNVTHKKPYQSYEGKTNLLTAFIGYVNDLNKLQRFKLSAQKSHHWLKCTFQLSCHNFQKFFGPFSLPLGGFCPPFSNSPSHAPYPHIFPNFRPFFTLPSSGYPPPDDRHAPSTNRGDQPKARRPYMANILYYTLNFTFSLPVTVKRWSLTSTVTPTPSIYFRV